MTDGFDIKFMGIDGQQVSHFLNLGEIFFVLGANGTGKSSLISELYRTHHQHAKRISAHRQTWFTSNTLNMTPQLRDSAEKNIKSVDQDIRSRYREDYAAERTNVAIYDLIDFDIMLAREIADLVRAQEIEEALNKAKNPSPIQVINELMRLSNISVEIGLEERQRIMAYHSNGASYSIAELSDGERAAFLIAAAVLTAKPETLLLIDEPERHLHRSIISPLLTLLFEKRKDCAFIISTHEVMLPIDNPSASTLLLRSCEYVNSKANSWNVDILAPNAQIDDELKRNILGSRRKMIFVEGTATSLDAPLYSLLFPGISIIPRETCRDVEYAVKSLKSVEDVHWVKVWGIVDNDGRSTDDINHLKKHNVHALSLYSVEALYYHPEIIKKIAERQTRVTGGEPQKLYEDALADAVAAIKENKNHLLNKRIESLVKRKIFESRPSKDDICHKSKIEIEVDIASIRTTEEKALQHLILQNDLKKLLQSYPIRESGALDKIAKAIGLKHASKYQEAVRKLLKEDESATEFLRNFFEELLTEVAAD